MMDARARITLPDILYGVAAIAFTAALWPVVTDALEANLHLMSTGTVYLSRLLLPMMLLVMFALFYVKASGGVGQ